MSELDKRLEFDAQLRQILGSNNVYFQPPETMKLQYPCIVYFKTMVPVRYANNSPYIYRQGYTVTYIDKNPDSEVPYIILNTFRLDKIDSFYKSEGLNHTKLTIFNRR